MTRELRLPIDAGLVTLREVAGELVLERDGRHVGVLKVAADGPELTVESLCVDPAERGCGTGSSAARGLIREAARAGFDVFRAWAPPDRGLAVYFWFRMGLRPLPGDGPKGGIWLVRDLRAGASAASRRA